MSDIITLATVKDGDKFRFSSPGRYRMRPDGSLRPETWRDRWASALSEAFWPSPRFVVTSIDREAGRITLGER